MDAVILHFFRCADDKNVDNHAYVESKSCQSAIFELLEYLRHFRIRMKEAKRLGKLLIPLIFAEDISGAFESISHEIIALFIQATFDPTMSDVDLVGLVLSYLDRKAVIKENGNTAELKRRHKLQTSPQGSILSPKFWRVVDGVFSHIYKNSLKVVTKEFEFIESFFHVAYADDHITVVGLLVDENLQTTEIQELILEVSDTCRCLLDNATKDVGCGINLKKIRNCGPETVRKPRKEPQI